MLLPDKPEPRPQRTEFARKGPYGKPANGRYNERRPYGDRRNERPAEPRAQEAPMKRGKQKLSPEAKARLLDAEHLDQFEIGANGRKNDRFRGNRKNRPPRSFDRRPNRKPNQKKHHG